MYDRNDHDGRCGIVSTFQAADGTRFRCRLEVGHGGDHDWKRLEDRFVIRAGVFHEDMVKWFHPKPEHCTCQPIREMSGKIIDWVFSPTCTAHAKKPV